MGQKSSRGQTPGYQGFFCPQITQISLNILGALTNRTRTLHPFFEELVAPFEGLRWRAVACGMIIKAEAFRR